MTKVADARLHMVDSVEEAGDFLRWLGQRRDVLAIDTETTGLRLFAGDTVRLVQFGDTEEGWSISARRWYGVIEQALRLYDRPTVFHNANFDQHALDQVGLPLPPSRLIHDTYIMDHLIDPLRSHRLKQVAERLWYGSTAGESVLNEVKRVNKWDWKTIPEDHPAYWSYSAWDTVLTARVAGELWPQVNALRMREAYDREMAVQDIARRMENRGIYVDRRYTAALKEEWRIERETLIAELNALGLSNPGSNRQIAQAMQLTEQWDPDDWTDTGQPKVDSKILKGIDSDISRRVLRFRRLTKWTSSYLDQFLFESDNNGLLHPGVNSLAAKTGRMSMNRPPFHQLPRGPFIRTGVVPAEGNALWTADYDGQEFRVFAHWTGDPGLIAACNADVDIHTYSARLMYNDPTITKADPRRSSAKNGRYGRMYGAGPRKLSDTLGVTEGEARVWLENDDRMFPAIKAFMRQIEGTARERYLTEGLPYVWSIGGRRLATYSDSLYKLTNYKIQGDSADILKMKAIEMDAAGLMEYVRLFVHDETVIEAPIGNIEIPTEVANIMQDTTTLSVPLPCVATGPYKSWGEKYG